MSAVFSVTCGYRTDRNKGTAKLKHDKKKHLQHCYTVDSHKKTTLDAALKKRSQFLNALVRNFRPAVVVEILVVVHADLVAKPRVTVELLEFPKESPLSSCRRLQVQIACPPGPLFKLLPTTAVLPA
jgi:hypothetical protein